MQRKVANFESMVSGHCTTLCAHVVSMRTSYFDIDFASQMKLTKFPLIHCFVNQFCFRNFLKAPRCPSSGATVSVPSSVCCLTYSNRCQGLQSRNQKFARVTHPFSGTGAIVPGRSLSNLLLR